jgi:hypothetical protein
MEMNERRPKRRMTRAEQDIKNRKMAEEGAKAMNDYRRNAQNAIDRIARLRAARLASETAE